MPLRSLIYRERERRTEENLNERRPFRYAELSLNVLMQV